MRCPFCGNDDTQVKDSRPTEAAVREEVRALCRRFPIYPELTV